MYRPVRFLPGSWLVAIVLLQLTPATAAAQDHEYQAAQETWRAEREARLVADDGWLTITGLHFLRNGENTFGASPVNDLVVPQGPDVAGVFEVRGQEVFVRAIQGHTLSVDGQPLAASKLYPTGHDEDEPRTVQIGDVTLWVHRSGDRLAIRMRDLNSEIRKTFAGLTWFAVDSRYRVRARFVPHDEPITVTLPNILGDIEPFTSHGSVTLTVNGHELTMLPVTSEERLWFIFRDMTSGAETYPAARFLYADAPDEDGWTTVDFNRAYNPPCAFNPYTTCPLPPQPNRLRVRIEAGEKNYDPASSATARRGGL